MRSSSAMERCMKPRMSGDGQWSLKHSLDSADV